MRGASKISAELRRKMGRRSSIGHQAKRALGRSVRVCFRDFACANIKLNRRMIGRRDHVLKSDVSDAARHGAEEAARTPFGGALDCEDAGSEAEQAETSSSERTGSLSSVIVGDFSRPAAK